MSNHQFTPEQFHARAVLHIAHAFLNDPADEKKKNTYCIAMEEFVQAYGQKAPTIFRSLHDELKEAVINADVEEEYSGLLKVMKDLERATEVLLTGQEFENFMRKAL